MRKLILPVVAFASLIVVGGAVIAMSDKAEKTTAATATVPAAPPAPAAVPATATSAASAPMPTDMAPKVDVSKPVASSLIKDAPLKTDFVMGDKKAPVVIVEYASLSCPHCAHFANDVLPKLEEKYIKTGKVKYVLRMFPLNAPAMTGAMLLQCLGEKSSDQYYTFARVLFEAQDKWAFDTNYVTSLQTIAAVGGVTGEQFQACVNQDRETQLLTMKKQANDELKVPHTPYFYIGGYAYEGPKDFENVSKFIDAKLAKK